MKSEPVLQRLDASIHGEPQPATDGFSVFRLLIKLTRSAPSRDYLTRPRRSIDRQAQEWWLSHE